MPFTLLINQQNPNPKFLPHLVKQNNRIRDRSNRKKQIQYIAEAKPDNYNLGRWRKLEPLNYKFFSATTKNHLYHMIYNSKFELKTNFN